VVAWKLQDSAMSSTRRLVRSTDSRPLAKLISRYLRAGDICR
jgi:hypothetical protein